jgi:hypothetical protein
MAFCHAILPALRQLLDPADLPHTAPPGVADATPQDLLPRLYAVIECAALSTDEGLHTAIATELGDGGYGRLSQADLLICAGPGTGRLINGPEP